MAGERYRQDIDGYIRRRDEAERYMGRRDPVPVPPTVRSHIPGYPEYVDRSRCDIRPEPLNNKGPYGDGLDIVKQLSLEWTPAGPGEQDKEQDKEQ